MQCSTSKLSSGSKSMLISRTVGMDIGRVLLLCSYTLHCAFRSLLHEGVFVKVPDTHNDTLPMSTAYSTRSISPESCTNFWRGGFSPYTFRPQNAARYSAGRLMVQVACLNHSTTIGDSTKHRYLLRDVNIILLHILVSRESCCAASNVQPTTIFYRLSAFCPS